MSLIDRCQILLVEPSEGGNLGSACRALMNCGFGAPGLVRPDIEDWPGARKMAVHASGLVERAARYETLTEAVAGAHWVVGVSGRPRKHSERKPPIGPTELVARLAALPAGTRAALVFGPERTGLTNAQLGRCQDVLCLPTSPDYPSMNLAHAVLVVAWTVRMAMLEGQADAQVAQGIEAPPMASAEDLERLVDHTHQTLDVIGFFDQQNPRLMLDEFRKIFARARLSLREMRMFRGMLHRMDVWVARHGGPPTPNQSQDQVAQDDGGGG